MSKWIMICVALCFLIGKANAQQNGAPASVYNTDRLVAGETVQIVYNPSQTPLAGAEAVDGIVYFWKDYAWTADEVVLMRRDSSWQGTFRIPLGTALVCTVFKSGDVVDKGGVATYAQMTFNPETNTNYPSAYVGWGILRNPLLSATYGVPDYCDSINRIGNDVMFYWIKQQLTYFPGERANVLKYAIPVLRAMEGDSPKVEQALRGEVAFVLEDPSSTEQQLMDAMRLVRAELREDSLYRALEAKALAKFPEGLVARDKATMEASRNFGADKDARMATLDGLFRQFPPERFLYRESDGDKRYYDILRGYVYLPVVEARDYSTLYKYMKSSPGWLLSTYFWHLVQLPYQNGEQTAGQLERMASDLVREILARPAEGDERLLTPSEYAAQRVDRNSRQFFAYAQILADCGRSAEALAWMEKLQPIYGYKDASFNECYVNLLAKCATEVVPRIENSIGENAATQSMLDKLQDDYVARHKSARGFEAYVDGLKSAELLQALQAEVKKAMVKEKIAPFTLTDLKGKTVSSAALKGKIIVLDFWATWCAPCKAALPAMQMAVHKYSKDKDVVFYFVTTQEKPAGLVKKVKEYVEEKGYGDMNFVFDLPGEGKVNDRFYAALAAQFHFSGIPVKAVIDGDGNLRWCSVGYMGSPTELVDEIGFVIEEIKKEKK